MFVFEDRSTLKIVIDGWKCFHFFHRCLWNAQCLHSMCSLRTDGALKRQTNVNQNLKTLWLLLRKYAQALTLTEVEKVYFQEVRLQPPGWLISTCEITNFLMYLTFIHSAHLIPCWKMRRYTFNILYIFTISQEVTPSPLRVNTAIYRGNPAEAAFTRWLPPFPLPLKGSPPISKLKAKS